MRWKSSSSANSTLAVLLAVLPALWLVRCDALVDETTFQDVVSDVRVADRVEPADVSETDLSADDTGCAFIDCGGQCCEEDEVCVEGVCCEPACKENGCGDDGCGGSCGVCDDGFICSGENVCECDAVSNCEGKECGDDGCGGTCGQCASGGCGPDEFSPAVQKINSLAVGKGGYPGEGLDVDNDPDTCSPTDDCDSGINNQMAGLLSQLSQFVDADSELMNALEEGQIVLLLESVGLKTDGTVFIVNFYMAELVEDKETCDYQAEKCEYMVKQESFDPATCNPVATFDDARITDGKLTGGGPEAVFVISIPIVEGVSVDLAANMAQLAGDAVFDRGEMFLDNGVMAGAIRKDKLMEAIDLIPEDPEFELPVSKDMIKNLLNMFVKPDVDTDDDGTADAASIGIKFTSIPGTIAGIGAVLETVCTEEGQCVSVE